MACRPVLPLYTYTMLRPLLLLLLTVAWFRTWPPYSPRGASTAHGGDEAVQVD